MAVTAIVVGMGMSAVGSVVSYNTQQNALDKQDAYNKEKQKMLNEQAKFEEAQGVWEAAQIRNKAKKIKAMQDAAFAGSGVKLFEGTAMDVTQETEVLSEVDALTALKDSSNRAKRIRDEGVLAGRPEIRTESAVGTGLTILGDGLQAYGAYKGINNKSVEKATSTASMFA